MKIKIYKAGSISAEQEIFAHRIELEIQQPNKSFATYILWFDDNNKLDIHTGLGTLCVFPRAANSVTLGINIDAIEGYSNGRK